MKRLLLLALVSVGLIAAPTTGAAAHGGAAPYVLVPADFILPGQPFEVVVADIGQDAPVDFEIAKDERTDPLGTSRAAPDGHLMTDLLLPGDFPVGYAQLFANVEDVIAASTWVLVGERTSDTPPPPSTASAAAWWTDPSVLVLGALVIGALGVLGYLVFKPKTPKPSPQPVNATRRRARKRGRG